ncbi:MAG TPA: CRISPR-associated endonuclease Cas2 [Erysipelothrix sp.]
MRYLISYDISDVRRLRKIYKIISGAALPIQESVYLFVGSEPLFQNLIKELQSVIHPRNDDVRIYALNHHSDIWSSGNALAQEGILLI